ncbi:MAG: hypothetical protein IJ605_06520 [Prevotella sp.]|nr:hypothetical protein [Prevotella sp.]
MKISKNRYLQIFCLVVVALGVVRAIFPSVAMTTEEKSQAAAAVEEERAEMLAQELVATPEETPKPEQRPMETQPQKAVERQENTGGSRFFNADGTVARRRILSVSSYTEAFPDAQDVQIASANKWGVTPVKNRSEAENRKAELVYVGSNPYFFVEPLTQSIPYLVPKAAVLLQDIGRNFIDSLQVKGLASHKIIVTSVMRSQDDVERLRRYNRNATENSCHMYGTTFDIAYNRYLSVEETPPPYTKQATVADVRLKQILSEVLRDLRREGRCWVKYEVKQGCFHLTVR